MPELIYIQELRGIHTEYAPKIAHRFNNYIKYRKIEENLNRKNVQ